MKIQRENGAKQRTGIDIEQLTEMFKKYNPIQINLFFSVNSYSDIDRGIPCDILHIIKHLFLTAGIHYKHQSINVDFLKFAIYTFFSDTLGIKERATFGTVYFSNKYFCCDDLIYVRVSLLAKRCRGLDYDRFLDNGSSLLNNVTSSV